MGTPIECRIDCLMPILAGPNFSCVPPYCIPSPLKFVLQKSGKQAIRMRVGEEDPSPLPLMEPVNTTRSPRYRPLFAVYELTHYPLAAARKVPQLGIISSRASVAD
jgi:hypothetical protein